MIKVYIASAYTIGDVAVNVRKQIDVANVLWERGFNPFVPLYYHFQHMFHPKEYEFWTKVDLDWIDVCDCLLRLPGESKGADKEVEYAMDKDIPVFESVEQLLFYYHKL